MARRFITLAAATAVLLAAPAAAEDTTPAQNLDCAAWAAFQIGVSDDEAVRDGLSIAVAWFIGLYEGQTGKTIDEALAARGAQLDRAAINALTPGCVARFSTFADRLSTLGAEMEKSGK